MAGLTKQHFNKIAKILNNQYNKTSIIQAMDTGNKTAIIKICEDLSKYFKSQNPLFNENRFKKACLE